VCLLENSCAGGKFSVYYSEYWPADDVHQRAH
jgi:hypothetical protein